MTGNGSYLSMQKLAWKNSWNHIPIVTYFWRVFSHLKPMCLVRVQSRCDVKVRSEEHWVGWRGNTSQRWISAIWTELASSGFVSVSATHCGAALRARRHCDLAQCSSALLLQRAQPCWATLTTLVLLGIAWVSARPQKQFTLSNPSYSWAK